MPAASRARGRPFDPAVGEAVRAATLDLIEEHGYDGLRVADVAKRAGTGLGALYRRWPDKRTLVLDALRGAVSRLEVPETDDPRADVLAGLQVIADGLSTRSKPLLAVVLAGTDPVLAEAIREAKLAPLRAAHRARVRRVLGDVPDVDLRADLGPALIISDLIVHGRPPSPARLRDEILPLVLGSHTIENDD